MTAGYFGPGKVQSESDKAQPQWTNEEREAVRIGLRNELTELVKKIALGRITPDRVSHMINLMDQKLCAARKLGVTNAQTLDLKIVGSERDAIESLILFALSTIAVQKCIFKRLREMLEGIGTEGEFLIDIKKFEVNPKMPLGLKNKDASGAKGDKEASAGLLIHDHRWDR